MLVGMPKEVKDNEYRVGLGPRQCNADLLKYRRPRALLQNRFPATRPKIAERIFDQDQSTVASSCEHSHWPTQARSAKCGSYVYKGRCR